MSDPVPVDLIVPPKISPEFLQAVAAAAQKAGLPMPSQEASAVAPTLPLEMGWRRLGMELGGILREQNIFLIGTDLVHVDVRTGTAIKFDQRNFAGWVEEFVVFTWKRERTSLIGEHAAMLMAQFTFRDQIKALQGVHKMRLPVQRADGSVEWLKPGYDESSKIFTCDLLQYAMDWDLEKSLKFLTSTCAGYPWMRADNEPQDGALEMNRSFAVHVAAMLGAYCRAMFPEGITRPMILYTANQQGSGKSTLAQMDFIPVFGLMAANDMPEDDDDLAKELASAAQDLTPFLFLDDIGTMLRSVKLNRFITAPRHAGRILGSKNRFDVPSVTQIFATGNDVQGSRDLAERALIVEMFYAGNLSERKFAQRITPQWLAQDSVRRDFLSALSALVRNWLNWRPSSREMFEKLEPHPRFPEWTQLIAEIVISAGMTNPLAPPMMPMAEAEDQVCELLRAAASAQAERVNVTFDRTQLVNLAREKELLEEIVGLKDDKELDSKGNKRFGLRLRPFRGRELTDDKGRRFCFGHKRQKHGATYPLTFL